MKPGVLAVAAAAVLAWLVYRKVQSFNPAASGPRPRYVPGTFIADPGDSYQAPIPDVGAWLDPTDASSWGDE